MPLDTQLESNIKILPVLWIRSSGSCVCMFRHSVMSDSLWLHGVAHKALLLIGFPSQEYWSGLPFPTPGDIPDPGIEPMSPVSPSLAGRFFNHWTTWEAPSDSHLPAYFQHLKEQFPSYYFVENTIIIASQQVSLAFILLRLLSVFCWSPSRWLALEQCAGMRSLTSREFCERHTFQWVLLTVQQAFLTSR